MCVAEVGSTMRHLSRVHAHTWLQKVQHNSQQQQQQQQTESNLLMCVAEAASTISNLDGCMLARS